MVKLFENPEFKLIKFFYENKKKEFHFNEISKETGILQGSLSPKLKALKEEKLLNLEKKANLSIYCVNPYNDKLISLFAMYDKEKIAKLPIRIQNIIKKIQNNIDSYFICIFGSFAKGNQTKTSDLDVFIAVKDKSLIKEYNIFKELEIEFGVKIDYSIAEYKATENQKHILKSAIPISNYENFYKTYFGVREDE
ncbi:MAG: nucleotidyltransferase family protein [Nanoarchaeota archaeon]